MSVSIWLALRLSTVLPLMGSEPIHVYLIQSEGVPIGWIQWYRWRDFPEHAIQVGADPMSAGIDLAIGEIEMTGRGFRARGHPGVRNELHFHERRHRCDRR